MVYETPRHNGTEEDTTATLEVNIVLNPDGCSQRIAKIKIPAGSSDKVICNRVKKAIAMLS